LTKLSCLFVCVFSFVIFQSFTLDTYKRNIVGCLSDTLYKFENPNSNPTRMYTKTATKMKIITGLEKIIRTYQKVFFDEALCILCGFYKFENHLDIVTHISINMNHSNEMFFVSVCLALSFSNVLGGVLSDTLFSDSN
jgi:hypothetical protein